MMVDKCPKGTHGSNGLFSIHREHSTVLNNTEILVFICNCVLGVLRANDIAQQMSRYDDGRYHIYECVYVHAFTNTGNISLINMNN